MKKILTILILFIGVVCCNAQNYLTQIDIMKFDISLFKLQAGCQDLSTDISLNSDKLLLVVESVDSNHSIPTNGLYDSSKVLKEGYIFQKESLRELYIALKQQYSILSKEMTTHEKKLYDSQFYAIDSLFIRIAASLVVFENTLDAYKIRLDYYSK